MNKVALAVLLAGLCGVTASAQGWKKIFDGKTLAGWHAPDMSYFTVEDGAITGTTTRLVVTRTVSLCCSAAAVFSAPFFCCPSD